MGDIPGRVSASLQRLPGQARQLVQAASCVGVRFDVPTVAYLARLSVQEASKALFQVMLHVLALSPSSSLLSDLQL